MKSRSGIGATALAEGSASDPRRTSDDALGFERLLAELAGVLVGVRPGNLDAAIRLGLERIVAALDADVGVVMESSAEGRGLRITHTFTRAEHDLKGSDLPEPQFTWLAERLASGDLTGLHRLDDLSPEAADDWRPIARRGAQSAVVCPFVVDGGFTAAVAVAAIGRAREWPDALVDRLRLVAPLFAAAVARRRAEERLAEEREFATAVLDSLPGLFFALDEQGCLARWNKSHETVLGYSADELRGLHFSTYIAPEDFPGAQVAFEKTWREGAGSVELHAVTRDGRRIPQFATGGIATIGGRRHVVGLAMDISALKAAQDQIRRQQAELAHVARVSAMGELAAAIAHELNQPLTAIRTNAQATRRMLARGAGEPAEFDEALADITADAVRASEIIRRLRDLLRKGDAERSPLDVNDLIREVEPFSRADVLEHSASFRMDLAPRLPRVMGDRIQLQQVVLNLIRNGSEAMRDAALERRELVVSTALSAAGTIEVTVSDSGPPLSDEAFGRMFQPFYTTKPGGLGIGLSLSRSIIEAHGGLLWATRNLLESGITMHFTLPVEPPAGG